MKQLIELFLKNKYPGAMLVLYGSRVYGTAVPYVSDWDYYVIGAGLTNDDQFLFHYREQIINVHTFQFDYFIDKIKNHEVFALESYYHDPELFNVKFNLDLNILRKTISAKASNSFVKAKKKIELEKDFYIGLKSLSHSLRIFKFGIQLAKHNGIISYPAMTSHHFDIVNQNILFKLKFENDFWDSFFPKYKLEYNRLHTEFKLCCPKQ